MITRIVKMHFKTEGVSTFLTIFEEMKQHISQSEGCISLALHRDMNHPDQFFTISTWITEKELNMYRESELFKLTWSRVKPLFAEKASAWTLTVPFFEAK